ISTLQASYPKSKIKYDDWRIFHHLSRLIFHCSSKYIIPYTYRDSKRSFPYMKTTNENTMVNKTVNTDNDSDSDEFEFVYNSKMPNRVKNLEDEKMYLENTSDTIKNYFLEYVTIGAYPLCEFLDNK